MIRTEKVVLVAAVLLLTAGGMLFAGGTPETPELPTTTSGTQYLSPNGDGVQEDATVTFSAALYVKSEAGYIPKYGLQILPPDGGEPVQSIVKTEKRDIGWFSALFTGFKKFTLERSVTWDGMNAEGETVPDGSYDLRLWVEDASGKRQEKIIENFVVDTVPPEAVIVEPEYMVFSPDGDGNRDTITISHEKASEEHLWTAEFRNADGETVRSYRWENGTPGDAVWKGETDAGNNAPAGIYDYVLSSTDRAGNESGEIRLEGIELVREDTPVEVVITPGSFSPDDDGVKDKATAHLDQAQKEGIVGWSWRVTDADGNTVEEHEFTEKEVPETVTLDGKTSEGEPYRPGSYRFSYSVEYRFGNVPSASEPFTVDVTPPEPKVELENPLFSPNGDGNKETVRIRADVDEEVSWEGRILDQWGNEVLSSESDSAEGILAWDGRNAEGEQVESGVYTLKAEFTDEAGNTAQITPQQIVLDTRPIRLSLSAPKGFSPNGDGKNDKLPVTVSSSKHNQVDRWIMTVRPAEGGSNRVYSGQILLPKEVRWDGNVSVGESGGRREAPEGRYYAVMEVRYERGDLVEAETESFLLDLTPPRVGVKTATNPFAETDTGLSGEVFITLEVEEETSVEKWSMEIRDEDGDVVRTYGGEGDPTGDIVWNTAETEEGKEFKGESFTLNFEVEDASGNTRSFTKTVPLDIFLVERNGKRYLAVPDIIFGAYQYALDSRGQEMYRENIDSLERVVSIFERYPEHRLLLEGHALNIYRGTGREQEEEEVLQPLTVNRARTVKEALVERGMDADRIETEAYGGTRPIVSVTDKEVRWKNRRVEFVLLPPKE
jgi:flagellar hook assembly protein FlgD